MKKHTITQTDLDMNPDLVTQGIKVGDKVKIPIDGPALDIKEIPIEGAVYDLEKARDERCMPVVKEVLQKMLDSNLLFGDKEYIKARVKQYVEYLIQNIVAEHIEQVLLTLDKSLTTSFEIANKKLWNDKNMGEIMLKDIDDLLKNK